MIQRVSSSWTIIYTSLLLYKPSLILRETTIQKDSIASSKTATQRQTKKRQWRKLCVCVFNAFWFEYDYIAQDGGKIDGSRGCHRGSWINPPQPLLSQKSVWLSCHECGTSTHLPSIKNLNYSYFTLILTNYSYKIHIVVSKCTTIYLSNIHATMMTQRDNGVLYWEAKPSFPLNENMLAIL